MRTLLNLIWFVFGGFWLALGYLVAGIISFLFIVTIPCGVAAFRMARYVAWPFGKAVVPDPAAGKLFGVANIIWFITAGWWLVLLHIATALAQSLTIIGVMHALVNLKMIPLSCFPFGKRIVDRRRFAAGFAPLHSI
ncbi:MAG: YccF domain-containing protein [Propionibacteriaceae bacterium]